MKNEALKLIENLQGFLTNIKSINEHPYSMGIKIDKLIQDLQDYTIDLKKTIESIDEISEDLVSMPDKEEESEK